MSRKLEQEVRLKTEGNKRVLAVRSWPSEAAKNRFGRATPPLCSRPDQDKIFYHPSERQALSHHDQTCKRFTSRETVERCGGHGVHVVGNDNHLVLRGEPQNLVVRLIVHSDPPSPDETERGFTPQNSVHDVLVQVVIGEECNPTHEPSGTSAFGRARSRSATADRRCAAFARHRSHTSPWFCRYSLTSSRWER